MGILSKILALVGYEVVKSSSLADLKEKINKLSTFQLTENSKELIKSIENDKIKVLEKSMSQLITAVCKMNNTISEEKEFLVDIASLQEQLLHELDQGKIIIVKNGDFDIGSVLNDNDNEPEKSSSEHNQDSIKKYDLN